MVNSAPQNYLRDVSVTVFLAAWIPLFGAFRGVADLSGGRFARKFTMLLVVVRDVGGYTAGVLFGKHPMVPAISPKKSWEGSGRVVAVRHHRGGPVGDLLLHHPWWIGIPSASSW